MKLIGSTFLALFVSQVQGNEKESSLALRAAKNTKGIAVPWFRYRLYETLEPTVESAAKSLAYTETTWNLPGAAEVEIYSYDEMDTEQQELVTALGFLDKNEWDCYVNHWEYYDWNDFPEGIQSYWEALGWTEGNWENGADPPASEDKFFSELAAAEKTAAEELCFFAETWDGESMDDWAALPAAKETRSPTTPLLDAPAAAPGDDTCTGYLLGSLDCKTSVTQS